MDKCNLCRINQAEKKGSHIVPHFLLKRIENVDGKTGRDYEIGFTIKGLDANSHFGRSVLPERLAESYGELTDDDINNNNHPLVVDHFLCYSCEDRLAQIESQYSKTINNIEEENYKSGISSSNGILFWGSIFWRLSVHGKSGVKLTTKQNEALRVVLNSFLPQKNETLNEDSIVEHDIAKNISYKIIRCNNSEKEDPKWLLFHPEFYHSFCLFIDEFVVAFSLDDKFKEFETTDCFGVNDLIIDAPLNGINGKEEIKPYKRTRMIKFGKEIVKKIADNYLSYLEEFLDQVHVNVGGAGTQMPLKIKQEILTEITSNEKKIGRRYTNEDIIKSAFMVMKKYAP